MAKRKGAVNDIIYELDNEDIEISSDEEVKAPKITRLVADITPNAAQTDTLIEESSTGIINLDDSYEDTSKNNQTNHSENGGKTSEFLGTIEILDNSDSQIELNTCESNKMSADTIYNEDIEVDSPMSNDVVAGCQNRIPLVSVRFRDNKIASNYKKQIKDFMMSLIKIHGGEVDSEYETDVELDIWPEDVEQVVEEEVSTTQDSLFFVDTDPCENEQVEIPTYQQTSAAIMNTPAQEPTPPPLRRGPICFNCDGNHPLRDCPLPRNNAKIAENRRNVLNTKVGRYHIEDEQKYGHLIPGRISGALRHALGLKRHELPLHIYKMRLLGYPPGWLEDARISHSGITLFDSGGNAILDPEEEDGELCEPGSKDKFDIKKILDFPGFNVPASPRYKEEAHIIGLPPMSDKDSKMAMLQMLAPNAMKAYKRKKLTMFPSTSANKTLEGQAEMEIDSGEEAIEFPSIPPLPDEAPPPPLPPPPPPPESPEPIKHPVEPTSPDQIPKDSKTNSIEPKSSSKGTETGSEDKSIKDAIDQETILMDQKSTSEKQNTDSADDELEIVNVMKVSEIPIPEADIIISDDDGTLPSSGRGSPSIDDLEAKKQLLLEALKGNNCEETNVSVDTLEADPNRFNLEEPVKECDDDKMEEELRSTQSTDEVIVTEIQDSNTRLTEKFENTSQAGEDDVESDGSASKSEVTTPSRNDTDFKIPTEKLKGGVKTSSYGTPVLNIASHYVKLPSDNNFAKDICDVINFENLPNSTGKYKKISNLLKKVKNEVDRIQGS